MRRGQMPYRADPTYYRVDNPQPQSWARFGLRDNLLEGNHLRSNTSNQRARLLPVSPQRLPRVQPNHPTVVAVRSMEIGNKARRQGYGKRR